MNGFFRYAALSSVVLAMSLAGLAQDPDPRPSSFFGSVTVDGNPVADGTRVSARIGADELAVAFTFTHDGASVFLLDVPADDPLTPEAEGGVDGQPVIFRIESVDAPETGIWFDGSHALVDLTGTAGTDLRLSKSNTVTGVAPGDSLIYTLTVTNDGPLAATGIVLEDLVPENTTFIAASDGGSEAAGVVTWPAFDLADGASAIRTLTVEVAATFPGGTTEISNTATVRSDGADGVDPDPADNTALDVDALAGGPDVAVEKTADITSVGPGAGRGLHDHPYQHRFPRCPRRRAHGYPAGGSDLSHRLGRRYRSRWYRNGWHRHLAGDDGRPRRDRDPHRARAPAGGCRLGCRGAQQHRGSDDSSLRRRPGEQQRGARAAGVG